MAHQGNATEGIVAAARAVVTGAAAIHVLKKAGAIREAPVVAKDAAAVAEALTGEAAEAVKDAAVAVSTGAAAEEVPNTNQGNAAAILILNHVKEAVAALTTSQENAAVILKRVNVAEATLLLNQGNAAAAAIINHANGKAAVHLNVK